MPAAPLHARCLYPKWAPRSLPAGTGRLRCCRSLRGPRHSCLCLPPTAQRSGTGGRDGCVGVGVVVVAAGAYTLLSTATPTATTIAVRCWPGGWRLRIADRVPLQVIDGHELGAVVSAAAGTVCTAASAARTVSTAASAVATQAGSVAVGGAATCLGACWLGLPLPSMTPLIITMAVSDTVGCRAP
eukprot:366096-Pelagomonas_calceolata.AAC.7